MGEKMSAKEMKTGKEGKENERTGKGSRTVR